MENVLENASMTYASGGRVRQQRRKQDCSGLSVLSYLGAQPTGTAHAHLSEMS